MSLLVLLGAVLRLASILLWLLLFARFTVFVGTTASRMGLVLYLQECMPTRFRGALAYSSEIGFSSMALLGMVLGMESVLGSNLVLLTGFAIPPCIAALLALLPMPETPKFLMLVRGDRRAAARSVHFYQGCDGVDAEAVLREIEQETEPRAPACSSILIIFRTGHLRAAVLLGYAVAVNTFSLSAIMLSSTHFLNGSHVPAAWAQYGSTVMAALFLVATVAGALSVERLGRRTIFLMCATVNVVLFTLYAVFVKLGQMLPGELLQRLESLLEVGGYKITNFRVSGPSLWKPGLLRPLRLLLRLRRRPGGHVPHHRAGAPAPPFQSLLRHRAAGAAHSHRL